MRSYLLLLLLAALAHLANAQVRTDFNNSDIITARGKFQREFRAKSPFVISARDIKASLVRDSLENTTGQPKPFKIADAIAVDIDVVSEASWTSDNNFAYGKLSIVAAGARSISANFDQFYLPTGSELYVYNENGEMITGPIDESENRPDSFWGTWVYKGNRLTVDFKIPVESKPALKLQH